MIDREEDADEDDEMHPPDEVEDVSPATNGGGSGAAPAGAGSSGSAPPASAPTGPRLLFRGPGRRTVSPNNERTASCARCGPRLRRRRRRRSRRRRGYQAQHGVSVGTHARAPVRGHPQGAATAAPASRSGREQRNDQCGRAPDAGRGDGGAWTRRIVAPRSAACSPRFAGSCAATPSSRTLGPGECHPLCALCASQCLRVGVPTRRFEW